MAGALVLASPALFPAPDLLWTPLHGRPLLAWSVAACEQTPLIAETALLVEEGRVADAEALTRSEGWAHVRVLVGGQNARASVEHGLRALNPSLRWVVVVEAARPLVTADLLAAALELAERSDADVVTGAPIKETVKRLRDGLAVETLPRERMIRVQPPQVFARERLLAAHAAIPQEREFADEAALALAAGLRLRILPGPADNPRVASMADVAVAEALLAARDVAG
jgi:2-C-methyl-D-erythritol 4-phosphate cytidylyltransferase